MMPLYFAAYFDGLNSWGFEGALDFGRRLRLIYSDALKGQRFGGIAAIQTKVITALNLVSHNVLFDITSLLNAQSDSFF